MEELTTGWCVRELEISNRPSRGIEDRLLAEAAKVGQILDVSLGSAGSFE